MGGVCTKGVKVDDQKTPTHKPATTDASPSPSFVSDRLVIYSSNTPDKDDFKKMLTCAGFEYPFDNTGMEMSRIIETAVKLHSPGGKGFTSIALACHGPASKKGGGSYDKATFEWEISEFIRVNTAEELRTEEHPVRVLMQCLGNAVVKGGRVDLLACNLLLLDEGKAIFAEIEAATQTNFAASCDLTGNPTNPGQNWIMESDNIDIFPLYFCKDAAESFDGKFGFNPLGWVQTAATAAGSAVVAAGTAAGSAVATVATGVVNMGGVLNPIHHAAMADARAQVEAMGITADHSAELGLAELALMASAAYDLHEADTVRDTNPDNAKLIKKGWHVDWAVAQPDYAAEYPEKLAMAVFVKGEIAVLALKGTDPGSMSDVHLDASSIVGGVPPCGPLLLAAAKVQEYQANGKSVMVTGHSLGGYMAEVVATNCQISGVGFCAPGSGWHAGKAHAGFQNVNFQNDWAGNVGAGVFEHPQWSVYVEDSGRMPTHSIDYMVLCMANEGRSSFTNQNVVANCRSGWSGYYTSFTTPRP